MITGNIKLSPNDVGELKAATDDSNIYGKNVKVILISKAASEGLDFKNIRQVHILDPWYNNNRTEQIIGRAARYCSHKALPFNERNIEIYMYGTRTIDGLEPIDMYLYRLSERKSIQMGKVARVLKETAVDCILNKNISNLTRKKLNKKVDLQLSSGINIKYEVGSSPYTAACDFMDKCDYKCIPDKTDGVFGDNIQSYNQRFIVLNVDKLMQKIKQFYTERYVYTKDELCNQLKMRKIYPLIQINSALQQLITDPNERLTDMFGRIGNLVNIEEYYMFQPVEFGDTKITRFDRALPIDYKPNVLKYLVYEPLDKFSIMNSTTDITKIVGKTTDEDIKEEVINKIKADYNKTEGKEEEKGKVKSSEIFSFLDADSCKKVINIMSSIEIDGKKMNEKELRDFILYHNIDTLSFKQKKLMIEYIMEKASLDDVEDKIRAYIDDTMRFREGRNIGFLLKGKKQPPSMHKLLPIYKLKNNKLVEATPTETKSLTKIIDRTLRIPELYVESLSTKPVDLKKKYWTARAAGEGDLPFEQYIGFMAKINRKSIIVFKIKDTKSKRNSSYTCTQSIKPKVWTVLDDILSDETKEKKKKILDYIKKEIKYKAELCICLELFMRYYQKEKKNDKIWFLTEQEVLVNKIKT